MLKRILSGVLTAVLLFLAIPQVSFAATALKPKDAMEYTAEWLRRLYNACIYQTDPSTKVACDTAFFTPDLISVKSTGSELKITLMPFLNSSGGHEGAAAVTFDHVKYKFFLDPSTKFDNMQVGNGSSAIPVSEGSFQSSVKNSGHIGHSSPGGCDAAGYNPDNSNGDPDNYVYGSICAYTGNSPSGISSPIYAWLSIDGTDVDDGRRLELGEDVNVGGYKRTYLYSASSMRADLVDQKLDDEAIDPMSLILFVAKMHTLYHNKEIWDKLGMSTSWTALCDADFITNDSGQSTCSKYTCPIMQALTIGTSKGTIGTVHGRFDTLLSAADLFYDSSASRKDDSGHPFVHSLIVPFRSNMTYMETWSKYVGLVGDLGIYLPKDYGDQTNGIISDIQSITIGDLPATHFLTNAITGAFDVSPKWYEGDQFKKYTNTSSDTEILSKLREHCTLFNEDSVCSILYDEDTKSTRYSNFILVNYTATFLYEHGFVPKAQGSFSGDCMYLDEFKRLLEKVKDIMGNDSDINRHMSVIEDTIMLAEYAAIERENYAKFSAEEAQEEATLNRANYTASQLKSGTYTIQSSQLLALPTIIGNITDTQYAFYVDLSKLFKADKNSTQGIEYSIVTYGPSGTQGISYIDLTNYKDYINRDRLLDSLSSALLSVGDYEKFKDIFISKDTFDVMYEKSPIKKDSLNTRDKLVDACMYEAVKYACSDECPSSVKYRFLHRVWAALYEGDITGKTLITDSRPNWVVILESNVGDAKPTIAAQAQIDTFKASYALTKDLANDLLKGGQTLKIRADIVDFFAKYGYSDKVSDLITEVYEETKGNLKSFDISGIMTEPKLYEPCTYDKAGKYFYYQMLLSHEANIYANEVYADLVSDIVENGITLEGNSKQISVLVNIKSIVDRYRGSKTEELWTRKRDVKGVELTEEQESLRTLSGLYDYLLKLGFISSAEYSVDIYDESNPLTLFWTQSNNSNNITFSQDYNTGRALSATYIPMQTNVYDPYAMLDYVDTEWIENFHYKYGFYRKALLIDTNVDAAVDSYVSHTQGATRVATLQDLFNCESDIVLYIDEHFYGLSELADLQNKTYDRLASTNPGLFDKIANSISDMFSMFREVDFDVALKQTTDVYSDEIANNVSDMSLEIEYDSEGKMLTQLGKYDQYILMPDAIKEYIVKDEYTPMLGYAVVSAIYRNKDAYRVIYNSGVKRTPVFESSPTLATLSSATTEAKATIYNYALLKNLPAMTTVGYETSTDMTSPIYCDIYGNIVTESGLVVIPAACNATLHQGEQWQPITTGFLSSYGKEWYIPTSWNLDDEFMVKMFYKNEDEGRWEIRNKTIQNMEINFAQLSYADKAVNVALKEWYSFDLAFGNQINQYNSLNILHEVLRGAPLENIDFDAENLNSARKVDKSGLIAAAKLDNIVNSLNWDDDNSIMSIPRLSFIDNYQYVVVFIFKILLVIIVTALMITIYVDVLKAKISWRTLGRCVLTLVLGVSCVLLIPVSYDISYYQSNKLLLQDEAEYIMMLNTEKNMSGREIGVYEVTEPEQHTQIMLKLEDFEFNWLEVLPTVVTSDSINVMDAKYKEFLDNSLLANKDNVQAMNDGMYMDVQDIFDTSVLNFSTTSKQLYQKVSVDPVASYYIPYYYFLDALLTNMNDFNRSHNVYAYSTKIMRGGAVKTVNLSSAYFNSKEFMESNDSDYLGLYQLYETMGSMIILPIFNEESIESARQSQWFVGTLMPEEDVLARLELMDTKVKQFIMENKNLIGKVTDETFLKCMAMSLAIEYNNIFGIPSANAFEVYNLSNADLMRLTVADKASTLEGSPMSFSRFVYNEAGTPGVYAAVFLVIVTMFVQTMKTVITIAIMVLLIVSVFVFKILLRKSNHSIGGYLLTLLVICSTNILYAVILKVSLAIPQTGLAPTLCIIIQILIQLAYLLILAVVLVFALRDWKNIGFTHFENLAHTMKDKFSRRHSRSPKERYDSKPRGVDGWDYYRKLVKENERRMKKVGTH